ncbi:DUF6509 family protein [Priestia flexa]|uniref:DUF6509 family protein n=1 Tax=Priestia flexa TaxID=86664 RepID=A0ABU4JB21_9BACI|nr:DUF6509 family protein [Priestia flexa]MDW8518200.1 DUF6509 family protein [Priestia flexa]MEC0666902.1 DUF6509 family protein [Priestia flexa]MED3825593.1 DUF6509 family protein [Priestia flexa]WHX80337.1 DUF6509 family protein [Priestia flexa]
MFSIREYTVEKLQDPFGMLPGERYEFHLYIDVDEEDELYTGSDLGLRTLYIINDGKSSISQPYFYEISTNKVLDFELEDDEAVEVQAFCSKHLEAEKTGE